MANFGSLLQEYYVDLFRKNAEIRKKKLAALKTPEDVRAYIAELRAKFDRAYTFPTEKCPLDPQSCGVIQGDGYKLEKLIYYSRPNFPVTASLYIPENARPGKTPAILHVLGPDSLKKLSILQCLYSRYLFDFKCGFQITTYEDTEYGNGTCYSGIFVDI